jgi:hypothetical protein
MSTNGSLVVLDSGLRVGSGVRDGPPDSSSYGGGGSSGKSRSSIAVKPSSSGDLA